MNQSIEILACQILVDHILHAEQLVILIHALVYLHTLEAHLIVDLNVSFTLNAQVTWRVSEKNVRILVLEVVVTMQIVTYKTTFLHVLALKDMKEILSMVVIQNHHVSFCFSANPIKQLTTATF